MRRRSRTSRRGAPRSGAYGFDPDVRRRHELRVRAQRETPSPRMRRASRPRSRSHGSAMARDYATLDGVGYRIDWTSDAGQSRAFEPTPDEVAQHAGALAAGYNDPRNAPLHGPHRPRSSPTRSIEHYADMPPTKARASSCCSATARSPATATCAASADGAAEFAFMIGAPSAQGKGLGTRFATMIHAFGFRPARARTDLRVGRPGEHRVARACSRSSATRSTTARPRAPTPTSPATS